MQALPIWQTVPLFLLIIGILVIVHELGHYLAARRFGVEAPEFGIGFPPRSSRFGKRTVLLKSRVAALSFPKSFTSPKVWSRGRGSRTRPNNKTAKKFLLASPLWMMNHAA